MLSKTWIKKLGDPDLILDNPHYRNGSDMFLYKQSRVEQFLAENAEEYAKWLVDRDRCVAIFEANREKIESAMKLSRAKAAMLETQV